MPDAALMKRLAERRAERLRERSVGGGPKLQVVWTDHEGVDSPACRRASGFCRCRSGAGARARRDEGGGVAACASGRGGRDFQFSQSFLRLCVALLTTLWAASWASPAAIELAVPESAGPAAWQGLAAASPGFEVPADLSATNWSAEMSSRVAAAADGGGAAIG